MNIKQSVLKMFSLLSLLLCLQVSAQLSTQEVPIGFKYDFSKQELPIVVMPIVDTIKIREEDAQEEGLGLPPRFGFKHAVNLNLTSAGKRHILENGDKLYQLAIVCPGALSVNLLYDKFWLPDGAKFFIYSQDKKHHIGAFTETNNKGTKDNIQGFATGLIRGDTIILEYYLPKNSSEDGIISISGIVHGYKPMALLQYGFGNVPSWGFGGSNFCQVNINCSEGSNWQNEKRAIALIIIDGISFCTGTLINNTNNDFHPYLLTADHCLDVGAYNAVNNPNLTSWMFYWNYEHSSCSNGSTPMAFSTAGAKVLTNWQLNGAMINSSDFALLELTENPTQLSNYTPPFIPYYLGWDRTGNAPNSGVGIHHPRGDVKKITTYNAPPQIHSTQNYWSIKCSQTINGFSCLEPGSSGSPLINSSRRLVGQLLGGDTVNCSTLIQNDMSYYGRFSISWDRPNSVPTNRLKDWLHPSTTSAPNTLDGIMYSSPCTLPPATFSGTVNTGTITVRGSSVSASNATVLPGNKLNLIGCTNINITGPFTVQSGASFEAKAAP